MISMSISCISVDIILCIIFGDGIVDDISDELVALFGKVDMIGLHQVLFNPLLGRA